MKEAERRIIVFKSVIELLLPIWLLVRLQNNDVELEQNLPVLCCVHTFVCILSGTCIDSNLSHSVIYEG